VAEALAPAGDSRIGVDLHQQMVHAGKAQAGKLLGGRPHVEGYAHVIGADRCYLHLQTPQWPTAGRAVAAL
jgi:hypothetical protein